MIGRAPPDVMTQRHGTGWRNRPDVV